MPDRIIKGKQGRYKLIDVRGSGSMATVYVSRDLDSNRIFAVKVLRPEVANQVELLDRFHREAQILMMLTDPHIVRPVEYGDDGDTHYIVMDYVDGSTLKEQIVSSGVFTVDRALDVMLQAAEGLHAAHERQVIHRDVKPQNILVTTKNVVKLTDFGMARAQESVTLTKSGVFMGTPYYVSPEQADNSRGADIRSDLYSLACVFFELLTGHVPYEGSNAVDVVVKHVRLPVPSVCERRSELPAAFDEFFQKAMAKAPANRFQIPNDFIQEVEQLKRQMGLGASSGPLGSRSTGAMEAVQPELPRPQPQRLQTPSRSQPRPQLTLVANGQMIAMTGPQAIIGRSDPIRQIFPEVDLSTLDVDRMVSRRQARIAQHDGRFYVEDLKALNATRLNGVALPPNEEHELRDGDMLRAGNIEIRFNVRET
ncbi:MAG TPA: FHA domain-containing serine/threonine-protein kinase [Ktedonobacterales bacterium]|jgi:serine/threonine-protein kinase